MKKIGEMKADLMTLALPIGLIIVTAYPEYRVIFANAKFNDMLGFADEDERAQVMQKSAWSYVYAEDISWLQEVAAKQTGRSESYEIAYRMIKKDGSLIWVNQYSQHMLDDNDEELILAYYTDLTTQKRLEETNRAGVQRYETLIQSIPGGVGMYQLDDTLTPIFISERTYELCNMTKAEYEQVTRKSTLDVFHPDDRQGLVEIIKKARVEERKFEYTHRVLQKDGNYRWMRVSGQVMMGQEGRPILYTVFTDVHEQIVAEQALQESELRYSAAVRASSINIWEYDYQADAMTIFSTSPKVNLQNHVIQDYSHSVVEEGHIREDSAPLLFEMLEKLKNGEKEVTADLWIREEREAEFWCERVIYTNIFDANGEPIKAYCIGHDVTKEKEAEKRYRDELSYREAMQNATLASINVNLSQNSILMYKSQFSKQMEKMQAARTLQDYFDQVCLEIITEETQKQYAALFNREELLRRFANGETTLSMEVTRMLDDRRYWVILTIHMMRQVENADIVGFLYSTDITNERTMQKVMNAIVQTDYDFLVVVDASRNSAVRYSENELGHDYAQESKNFEEDTQMYISDYVCQEDIEHVIAELTIENIVKHLDDEGSYSIFYSAFNENGLLSKKQLRFNYIDRVFKTFLMARIDITTVVAEQEKKNQELVAALSMAECANTAKSEFLSRISHEIRTPMNAIIGMSQIAAQKIDDQVFALACIEKSLYASQYLLSLLNDILDMSKVESGNLVLKNEVIICQNFLEAISAIISVQAELKGVDYVATADIAPQMRYVGDSIRLQQIMINILSNAIKFTPSGGRVRLTISQLDADEKRANLCFRISDTGIGISEAFLPNLFKPFTQEHSGSTSSYGGSGLGLAISKNLAKLMGGDIFVQSTVGKGTIFTVHIPLTIPQDCPKTLAGDGISQEQLRYDFSGKRFLLVEDHQLNIMVARKLLEFKNAAVDVAENGQIALAVFADAPEQTYDAILMDIRMPIMDGLQATQSIRGLDNPWAKAVPIIAMSANNFGDDLIKSQEAGMDAHLAKPIDPELLYGTLDRLLAKK